MRATVDFDTSGSSKASSSAASTSRTDSPRRKEAITSASSGVRTRHALPDELAREPERRRVAQARALQLERPRGRLHGRRLVAVAVDRGLAGAPVAGPTEEVGELLLERLLEDQPGAEAADRLDRILLLADALDGGVELRAEALGRDYAGHGV